MEIDSLSSMMDPDSKREVQSKLRTCKDELERRKKEITKFEDRLTSEANLKKIQSGNTQGMSREQISQSTRDAAVDLNKKTDMQQDLINQIGTNLYTARDNMQVVTVEIDKQGEQIDRIHKNVGDTEKIVGRTDKRITGMNRRTYCHKVLLYLLMFVLFVAIIVMLIVKLIK